MIWYTNTALFLGGMALYVGVESLALYAQARQRISLWLGLLGIVITAYCLVSYRLYLATNLIEGARWEYWQLVLAGVLADLVVLLGLEYLGRLRARHVIGLAAVSGVLGGLLAIPGVGLTDRPAIKEIGWLGVRLYEVEVGPAATASFVIIVGLMAWMGGLLVRRAVHGTARDRIMAGVYCLWGLAAVNDVLMVSGVFTTLYLVELSFFLMLVVIAAMIATAQHQTVVRAEAAHRELAVAVVAKDRDLAAVQAELVEAAKLAAVGRLAAGVAHEVNNPLAYVMGNLETLAEELKPRAELAMLVAEAQEGAERIRRVVRQLFNFAHAQPDGSGRCEVKPAVESAVKMARLELRDRATVEVSGLDVPWVRIDEGHLAQVVLNLLVNAAHAIPAGQRDRNRVTVAAHHEGALVEISVTDTGAGIANDVLARLFEPFFTTKEAGMGLGLGLAISRELVRRAGGELSAENVQPHGARFRMRLTVADDANAGEPAAAGRSSSPRSKASEPRRRLLLVDDDPSVLRALRRHLEVTYDVATASSGNAALRWLSEGGEAELILCDLMMPDGSGLDVVRWLVQQRPGLARRTVLMTGGVAGQQPEHLEGEISFPVLAKPFRMSDFAEVAARLLPAAPAAPST